MALQNFGIKPIKDFLSDTYLIPDYQRESVFGNSFINNETFNSMLAMAI